MKTRASGRSALFIATALLIGTAAPLYAAPDDGAEQTSEASSQNESAGKPMTLAKPVRHFRKHAHRSKARVVARGYRGKPIGSNAVPMNDADQAAMPETVANANAQWTDRPSLAAAPDAAADKAIPADQVNDIDRALAQAPASDGNAVASQIATQVASQVVANDTRTAPTMNAMASTDQPQAVETDSSSWGQASLLGKLFIAAGGLLMLASFARAMIA